MIALYALAAAACPPVVPYTTPAEVVEWLDVPPDPAQLPAALEVAYHAAGYDAARVWYEPDRCPSMAVDPGRIEGVWFSGVGLIKRLTLADNIELEDGVLKRDLVDASVRRLERRLGTPATWSVVDADTRIRNDLGRPVPRQRVLVTVEGREKTGIEVSVDSAQPYGLVTGIGYRGKLAEGRWFAGVALGTPYHRWVTESVPRVRWTYGAVTGGWSSNRTWTPLVTLKLDLGNQNRPDLGLSRAYIPRGRLDVGTHVVRNANWTSTVFASIEVTDTFGVVLDPGFATKIRTDKIGRLLLGASLGWHGDHPRRRDLQHRFDVSVEGGLSHHLRGILRIEATGQESTRQGPLWLIARGKAWTRVGELRFYDQEPIGGAYQHVFFNQAYWAPHGAQSSLTARVPLARMLAVGAFQDTSVFLDSVTRRTEVVGSVGPTVNVLLTLVAVDLYYGFGLNLGGEFSHNFAINLSTVY